MAARVGRGNHAPDRVIRRSRERPINISRPDEPPKLIVVKQGSPAGAVGRANSAAFGIVGGCVGRSIRVSGRDRAAEIVVLKVGLATHLIDGHGLPTYRVIDDLSSSRVGMSSLHQPVQPVVLVNRSHSLDRPAR